MLFIIGIAIIVITILGLALSCLEEPAVSFFIILCGIPLVLAYLSAPMF